MRKIVIFIIFLLLVIGVWGYRFIVDRGEINAEPGTVPEEINERVTLRLKWLHQAQFAGFYTADKKGFYKDQGLDVELLPGGVDFPAIQMVASGSEDFGVTGADQLLLAREKGIPVVALMVIYRKSPVTFISLKDSGVEKLSDLVGKKVGVKFGQDTELQYRALLTKEGIDSSQIEEVPVKFDMSPLLTGEIAMFPAYQINEPLILDQQKKDYILFNPGDFGLNFYADTVFTTEKIIAENPELVKKFVDASLAGWDYAYEHTDEAVEYTVSYSDQLEKEHQTRMWEASLPLIKPDEKPIGWMDKEVWTEMQRNMLEYGFMKNEVVLDDAFTMKFMNDRGL